MQVYNLILSDNNHREYNCHGSSVVCLVNTKTTLAILKNFDGDCYLLTAEMLMQSILNSDDKTYGKPGEVQV